MPIGGEAFGSAIGGFFGKDKIRTIYDSEALNKYYETGILPQLEALGPAATQGVADYSAALRRATPELQEISRQNQLNLADLQRQYQTADPYAGYERLRAGNLGSLAGEFGNLASYGSGQDKLALAARGYGGRGPGTYEGIMRADRISRNIAPVLNTIYGNLGRDTSSLENARLNNLNANFGIMDRQMALPLQTAGLSLLPYQAQTQALAPQIALGRDLGSGITENIAGRQVVPNKWRNFFQQSGRAGDQMGDFALDAAITAASMYTGGQVPAGVGGQQPPPPPANSYWPSAQASPQRPQIPIGPPVGPRDPNFTYDGPQPLPPEAGYFPRPSPDEYGRWSPWNYQPPRPNYVYQW